MKVASKPAATLTASKRSFHPNYLFMLGGSIQFFVLTIIAMVLYPGGLLTDETTAGYNFFRNFFSDLGRTENYGGGTQWGSAILFFIALTLAGVCVIYYFVYAPRLFKGNRPATILTRIGSLFGIISGVCFIGVAFTPANLLLQPHVLFVQLAFTTFLVVVICYSIAIWITPYYPNSYVISYLVYGVFLIGYIYLLFGGPSARTDTGLIINATGQKLVAYASLITMGIQSVGAWRIDRK